MPNAEKDWDFPYTFSLAILHLQHTVVSSKKNDRCNPQIEIIAVA
jgi:hypothetical protein